MKKITILMMLCLLAASSKAQTIEEWFEQAKTQQKYLLEQIAALKVYAGYIEKGYELSKFGLKAIGDIKETDLNQHSEYHTSLKSVNPMIKEQSKAEDMMAIQLAIINIYEQAEAGIAESEMFHPEEVDYIHRVFSRLLTDCEGLITMLTGITTSGQFSMKDDERLERMNALHRNIQDNYTFAQHFKSMAMALGAYRIQSEKELQKSLVLNGIKTE